MPSVGAAPGHKRLNNEGPSGPPESKRQQTEASDDESTVIGDDNVADMEGVDEDGFKVVRHRKAKHCTAEQRCKRCGGPHNFRTCDRTEGFVCANCGGNHPASYSRCPIRSAALERKKRFIAGPNSHRELSRVKAATNSPKEGSRFDYAKDFPRLQLLDNTSNISAKTVKKSVTTANQKAISKRSSHKPLENTTTFVEVPVASTSTEAAASDSVSSRSSNRPYASTLSPTRATTEAPHSSSSDCDQVLRALFMALRSHIARMPDSSAKELLQVVLALEPVILSAASSH
ncbi:hypothetical protein HPB50_018743 [Hyalomma asiaticum]|uniref:Uncharacterized protein n=1 Tax=Hyalomma asiaticum TaxID=266040 RepID=A0ACB7T8H6_HYAAI|nr:hypothetical protein HPB50_018743 [Hyalomma asiaticum]